MLCWLSDGGVHTEASVTYTCLGNSACLWRSRMWNCACAQRQINHAKFLSCFVLSFVFFFFFFFQSTGVLTLSRRSVHSFPAWSLHGSGHAVRAQRFWPFALLIFSSMWIQQLLLFLLFNSNQAGTPHRWAEVALVWMSDEMLRNLSFSKPCKSGKLIIGDFATYS